LEAERVFADHAADDSQGRHHHDEETGQDDSARQLADGKSEPHGKPVKPAKPPRLNIGRGDYTVIANWFNEWNGRRLSERGRNNANKRWSKKRNSSGT
jgi:hypothetical protein